MAVITRNKARMMAAAADVVSGNYIKGHTLLARVSRMVQRMRLGEGKYCKAGLAARKKARAIRLGRAMAKANKARREAEIKAEPVIKVEEEEVIKMEDIPVYIKVEQED